MKYHAIFFGFLSLLFLLSSPFAQKFPWQRRIGRDIQVRHKLSYRQISPDIWPKEPDSPVPVAPEKFKDALSFLCGPMPEERLETLSSAVLRESSKFEIDPFLQAALMYHRSGCRPRTPEREIKRGLTRIDVDMHAPHIRSGNYRYFLKKDSKWLPQTLNVGEYRFNQWSTQKIKANLYFSAAILSVFSKQCKDLDKAFGSVPHRHFVSHWFFGDKVRHTEPEDAVLTVRRRLIAAYLKKTPRPVGEFNGTLLVSPLDGTPRLLLDYFGNKRGQKGGLGHQGIDLAGLTGEPVRAAAAGRISFAGIDLPGAATSRQTSPEEAAAVPKNALGKGGLWVTVNHENGFRTCYMHLDAITVRQGDEVKAGDIIGTLGNTGTISSGPHLHLEFRTGTGGREDPALYLKDILVDPWATSVKDRR
jgi:murein DD-endopeptidase MepM/ murein hydrolase activator NlpD